MHRTGFNPFDRHRGTGNAVFADGHVAVIRDIKAEVASKRLLARLDDAL